MNLDIKNVLWMLQKYRSEEKTLKNLNENYLQYYLAAQANKPDYPSAGKYLLCVNDELKFMWFMVPKVATRSIRKHLKSKSAKNKFLTGFKDYPVNLYAGYYKFAFVRNPYDRLVSCWLEKVVKKNHFNFSTSDFAEMQTFANFVSYVKGLNLKKSDRHLRQQSSLIDLNHVDFIGRLENIETDYPSLCRMLKLSPEILEFQNTSPNRKNYRYYYTDKLAEEVFELYEKDIRLFNYTF